MVHGLGVVLDSFGQPVREALQSASSLAFREIELPATRDEVTPEALSRTGRRHLAHYVSSLGLRLSALGADLGGGRFTDSASLERRLDQTRQVMELAAELHVPLVTTHLGRLSRQVLERGHLLEAVRHLAECADRTGTLITFETGGNPELIAQVLREAGSSMLGACYDPGSLLIDGYDPLAGVSPLADRILIARIRDATPGTSDFADADNRPGRETPLGEGQLDLPEYLAALDQAGYRRVPFLRRTQSDQPLRELAEARDRIEGMIR